MILVSANLWVRLVSVSSKILKPQRGGVSNITLPVLEARNPDTGKLVTTSPIERWDFDLFGWDRIAVGRSNIFLYKVR